MIPRSLPFSLPDHLPILHDTLRALTRPALVVLDPLHTLLSRAALNSRAVLDRLLADLADTARQFDVALVVVSHLSKHPTHRMLHRARGSLSYVVAARAVHLITADPDQPDRRFFASLKSAYGPPTPPLAFRITDHASCADSEISNLKSAILAEPSSAPRANSEISNLKSAIASVAHLEWEPPDSATRTGTRDLPPEILDLPAETHSMLNEACDWLAAYLADGPCAAASALHDARANGLSLATLRRAKRVLRVRSFKSRTDGTWLWSLPEPTSGQDAQTHGVCT